MLKNLILITVDCLRADELGFMVGRPGLTPAMDALAEQGVVCRRAFSCGPRTAESFPAILTASYPLMHDIDGHHLSQARLSLATVLQRNGLVTGAVHSNPVLSARYHYDRGFDDFWDSLGGSDGVHQLGFALAPRLRRLNGLYQALRQVYRAVGVTSNRPPFVRAEKIMNRAKGWLQEKRSAGDRFFLWTHLMDLHNPYLPLPEYQDRFLPASLTRRHVLDLSTRLVDEPGTLSAEEIAALRQLYRAQIAYVDDKLGEFVGWLQDSGLMDGTLLVLTADHGEEFGEHGGLGHAASVHRPENGRAQIKMYDELLHVPLLFYGLEGGRSEVLELVSLLDLSPTLLDTLGLSPISQWQGESFLSVIRGEMAAMREGVIAEYKVKGEEDVEGAVVAYRTAEWKFIYDGLYRRHELYHLPTDPQEMDNVVDRQPEVAQRMRGVVERHLDSLEAASCVELVEEPVSGEVLERLRALGYIE